MRETGLADTKEYTPIFIDRISFRELDKYLKKCKSRVILPIGSIEPHSTIFPLGTDKIIAEKLSIELARELNRVGKCTLIAPVLSYGVSIEWIKSNSTITLSPSTMLLLLRDIINSLRLMGFRIIIILNAHGGNSEIIRLVSRELVESYDCIKIIVIDWWRVISDIISKYSSTGSFMHSDEIEVSLLLYWNVIDRELLNEEIVRKGKLPWQKNSGIEVYERITRDQSIAAYGDPARASIELGGYIVREFCRRVVEIID